MFVLFLLSRVSCFLIIPLINALIFSHSLFRASEHIWLLLEHPSGGSIRMFSIGKTIYSNVLGWWFMLLIYYWFFFKIVRFYDLWWTKKTVDQSLRYRLIFGPPWRTDETHFAVMQVNCRMGAYIFSLKINHCHIMKGHCATL